jgi:predicted ester cyclase
MSTTDNKLLARRVLEEVFPANDDVALRKVISDRFVNHEAPNGTPPGLGSITMFMHMLNQAFSEQRWEIHDVLADGDKVVIRCTHSGVHTGDFLRPTCNRAPLRVQPDAHCPLRQRQGRRALGRA